MTVKVERQWFGTDGIRGEANRVLTPAMAVILGQAAGKIFTRGAHRHRVLIGKDTRLSGYMIESALVAGFTSAGMDVLLTGPIPTPGVATLTPLMRADLGVMISASHNPFDDNGIKLFGPDGNKLTDEQETDIERLMSEDLAGSLARGTSIGRARRIDGVPDRYVEHAKRTLPKRFVLDGFRIVIDCANGAAYKVAPQVLRELGAEVIAIHVEPDGTNINESCGSTHPDSLIRKVREVRADAGIALDGDGDRVLLTDEKGEVVNGDQILATVAPRWKREEKLHGPVVGTILSNLALEHYLAAQDIRFVRASVGDRYVLEMMQQENATLGGEESGHIIMSDHGTTGDGLITALQILAIAKSEGHSLSEIVRPYEPYPQIKRNVPGDRSLLETSRVQEAIEVAQIRLDGTGRMVVRPSGTESVIRLMVEGRDQSLIEEIIDAVARSFP